MEISRSQTRCRHLPTGAHLIRIFRPVALAIGKLVGAGAADRIVPGKEEAGVWAISHLPETLRGIVDQALIAYRTPDWPRTIRERQLSGGPWHRTPLIEFRDYMRSRSETGNVSEHRPDDGLCPKQ